MIRYLFISLFCCSALYAQDSATPVHDSTLIETVTHATEAAVDQVSEEVGDKKGFDVVTKIFSPSNIIWALIVILLGWLVLRLIKKLLEIWAERSARVRITIKGIIPIISITGWALIIYIVIVDVFNPPSETILAALASVGIAFGFAAQDILKNLFAGIIIIFDSPFKMGDKIESGNYYGEVIQIGLRSTKIVTPDDSVVTIPNNELMVNAVSNANTGEPNCQVVAEFYLPPDIDTKTVRRIAMEAAQVSKYIYLNKPISVLFFNELKEDRPYLKMRLKAYVMDIRSEFKFKSDMTERVMNALYKSEILDQTYFFKK